MIFFGGRVPTLYPQKTGHDISMKMMKSQTTIEQLRSLRMAHDVTLIKMAKRLGHSVTWLTYRELGYVKTTDDELRSINDALSEVIRDDNAR